MSLLRIVTFFLINGLAFSLHEKPYYKKEHALHYFNDFLKTYNKEYNEFERQERFKIFSENLDTYNTRNHIDSAVHGINQFSDLSAEEFSSKYLGLLPNYPDSSTCERVQDFDVMTQDAPPSFDWRDNNVVTPVKNQDVCGSCYTFSTVGNIESQYAIRNNEILDLSEQQILSCGQNNGCAGGLMTVSMQYVIDNAGIEEESDYPYENAKTTCKFNPQLAKVTLSGCKQYFLTDEEKLKEVLYKDGPIAVAIASSDILNYHGGVQKMCGGRVDHAVLLVGYGTDKFEGDYWILKNSWASTWGEQGFIRIARGSNTCSIMNNLMSSAILA